MIFVENDPDNLHCAQASLMMLVSCLTGRSMSMQEAEVATGFKPGRETWPYAMLAWLASQGFEVEHVDDLDALRLAQDPREELRRSGLDERTIEYFESISDFEFEADRIQAARRGGVKFVTALPSVAELPARIDAGWLALLSLNARTLDSGAVEEFDGHMVFCAKADAACATIQDPGPPARRDLAVPLPRLERALRSPVDSAGTITYIRVGS